MDRISFADDVFTNEINVWESAAWAAFWPGDVLGRVDALDLATAVEMKAAGCTRILLRTNPQLIDERKDYHGSGSPIR